MWLIVIYYRKNSIPIRFVKAGPISSPHSVMLKDANKISISPFEYFYHEGKKVNPRNYIVRKVDGDCMSPRGINTCDLIFIEEFKTVQEKENIQKGDIIYIKYTKDGSEGYKIREAAENKTNDDSIRTLYYSAEGNIKFSTDPHKLENIIGIVRMRFNN
jgi:hypothetical protein